MENNWKEKAYELIAGKVTTYKTFSETNQKIEYFENISVDYLVNKTLEVMDLVFEATKKECADRAKIKWVKDTNDFYGGYDLDKTNINKESILNIKKPNL